MEENTSRISMNGPHCGLCISFRDLGRCGNPTQPNRERGYFEEACGQFNTAAAIALTSPGAQSVHIPAGHLRCKYCGVILPATEMARGPYGFLRVCKPCKARISSEAYYKRKDRNHKTK